VNPCRFPLEPHARSCLAAQGAPHARRCLAAQAAWAPRTPVSGVTTLQAPARVPPATVCSWIGLALAAGAPLVGVRAPPAVAQGASARDLAPAAGLYRALPLFRPWPDLVLKYRFCERSKVRVVRSFPIALRRSLISFYFFNASPTNRVGSRGKRRFYFFSFSKRRGKITKSKK
jgi:hypothetical protein